MARANKAKPFVPKPDLGDFTEADKQHKATPVYKPANDALSPRAMWQSTTPKVEKKPKPVRPAEYAENEKEAFGNLTPAQKNIYAAGIVFSTTYRNFLKPHLESYIHHNRVPVRSDSEMYRMLEETAVNAFIENFLTHLEAMADKSPSAQHEE